MGREEGQPIMTEGDNLDPGAVTCEDVERERMPAWEGQPLLRQEPAQATHPLCSLSVPTGLDKLRVLSCVMWSP